MKNGSYVLVIAPKKCIGKFTALKGIKRDIAIKENVIEEFLDFKN